MHVLPLPCLCCDKGDVFVSTLALLLAKHSHLCPRQNHCSAFPNSPQLCGSVHGVCRGRLAIWVQPLHLPLLRGLHSVCKNTAFYY